MSSLDHRLERVLSATAEAVEVSGDLDAVRAESALVHVVPASTSGARRLMTAALAGGVAAAAVATIAFAAGMGDEADPPQGDGAGPAASSVEDPTTTTPPPRRQQPLDAYRDDAATTRVLGRAMDLLVTRCLASEGFPGALPEELRTTVATADVPDRSPLPFELGVTDVTAARRDGYQPRNGTLDTEAPSLTERFGAAYMGAFNRCTSAAGLELRGSEVQPQDVDDVVNVPGELAREATVRTQADARVHAAIAEWAGCMEVRGYDYRSPEEPPFDFADGEVLSPAEVATAVADVSCKDEARLVEVWLDAEADHQAALVDERRVALDSYDEWRRGRLERAHEVVGEGT
jgi:hypothetical protein